MASSSGEQLSKSLKHELTGYKGVFKHLKQLIAKEEMRQKARERFLQAWNEIFLDERSGGIKNVLLQYTKALETSE
jgi:hypothetical protein